MDVDVEPLPQTLRKSTREHITPDDPNADQLTSPNKEQHREDHGKAAIKRRKSSRPGQASVSEESSTQGESSATVASMDPNSQYGAKSHRRTSATSSTRHSSRSSDVAEGSVKYTPVTGRVSRAKKGQPVHVCDICKPSKVGSVEFICIARTDSLLDFHQSRTLETPSIESHQASFPVHIPRLWTCFPQARPTCQAYEQTVSRSALKVRAQLTT